jgi:hypothetical protein
VFTDCSRHIKEKHNGRAGRQAIHSVTLHWDGTSWSLVPNPDPFGGDGGLSQLFAASAVSPTDAWAVGTCTCLGTETKQTLILHWDGTAWSQV